MKVEVKKVVTLSDYDKEALHNAIDVLDKLNQETADEYEYNGLIADMEDILYHEPWEVEYEV